jgi:ubiquitin-like domain-containing CTD phosphatase 1
MFGPEAEAYRRGHHGKIPIIAHHTADKDKDILSPYRGEKLCPKQQDVMRRGLASDSYHQFFYSNESLVMRQLIDDELEPEGVLFGGTDCMMTSMCTDRSIPDVIDDYKTTVDETNKYTKKYGPNRFERLRDYVRLLLFLLLCVCGRFKIFAIG